MRTQKWSKAQAKAFVKTQKQSETSTALPDGTAVRLNVDRCLNKAAGVSMNPRYQAFVEANGNTLFHISRDDPKCSETIVVLREDETRPRWLFHTSDLIAGRRGEL